MKLYSCPYYMIKKILFILLVPLFLSVGLAALIKVKSPDPHAVYIDDIELKNYLIIDARSIEEYKVNHITNAMHADEIEGVKKHIKNHPLRKPIILVYCSKRCPYSRHFSKQIREELNQENIFYLKGGYESWLKSTPGKDKL